MFQGILDRLVGMRSGFDKAPSVVIVAKGGGRAVAGVAVEERGANFVKSRPAPSEINVGNIAIFCDAGNGDEFAAGSGHAEDGFFGVARGNEVLYGIDSGRSESDLPARRRGEGHGATDGGGGDPAFVLKKEIAGREVILVGDDAGAEVETLLGIEGWRGGDEVGGEAAGEEVAGRAGARNEHGSDTANQEKFLSHERWSSRT